MNQEVWAHVTHSSQLTEILKPKHLECYYMLSFLNVYTILKVSTVFTC